MLFLWPTYIGLKGRTLGKTYGIRVRYYWEHLWGTRWEHREHNENLIGTHRELQGNKGKKKKKSPSLPPPKLKRKKFKALWVHAEACYLAAWNFYFQKKTSHHHFWPGLIPPLINLGVLMFIHLCITVIRWGVAPTAFSHSFFLKKKLNGATLIGPSPVFVFFLASFRNLANLFSDHAKSLKILWYLGIFFVIFSK